ncbi:MAG: transposase [Thermodesulfobacteriota bacterium]|nr:transposase [Thermodesulfobacteriota bacterium]
MPDYRRYRIEGGCYFFTVNLLERHQNQLLVQQIDILRDVVRRVQVRHPFHIDGWVVLPDHMHCIWTLPQNDDDYAKRMRLVKTLFSKEMPKTERRSRVRQRKGERGIRQRRYREHTIRDERDYATHMDYLHFNPVKHGYVDRVIDWPYSTFRNHVQRGLYPENWGVGDIDICAGEPG